MNHYIIIIIIYIVLPTSYHEKVASSKWKYPYAAGYVYDVPCCITRTAGVLSRCFKARELPIVVERYVQAK